MKKVIRILIPVLILCCMLSVSFLLVACNSSSPDTTTDQTSESATTDANETVESTVPAETTTDTTDATSLTAQTGYKITFVCDEQATITVYTTQTPENGAVTDTAYARDSETGAILTDGNGQVNFSVTFSSGYEIGGIVVNGTYKNLKTPDETGVDGLYRITKIESDLTVTVKANPAETKYTATFVLSEGVTVTFYDTKDTSGSGTIATTAYARNGDTGAIQSDGEGQINFVVTVAAGYKIDEITVEGTYKNLKNDPEKEDATDTYRITKVSSDLTVTITTK